LNKSDIRALEYVVDSALKKIFDTNSKEIILEFRLMLDLDSLGDVLLKKAHRAALTSLLSVFLLFCASIYLFVCLFVCLFILQI